MTWRLGMFAVAVMVGAVSGCEKATAVADDIGGPGNLIYTLAPSGDPQSPAGLLLEWDGVVDDRLSEYRVYSRAADGARYDLRASTTSPSFYDVGKPDLDYYVTAVSLGGGESGPSNSVRIDERLRLPAPADISSISLNSAIHVSWEDNAFESRPSGFKWYRVYSTSYSLDNDLCGKNWVLEGTTVSPEFLAGTLTNGVPRCFGVSAESIEGFESLWSPLRADTPRPDSRNVVMYPLSVDATKAGFRFWQDNNGDNKVTGSELGFVGNGNATNIDFQIYLDANYRIYIQPIRTGTSVALYGTAPVTDLTSIDVAPTTGFATTAIEAVPGWGYVFKMSATDQFARFGAVRITHASKAYVILDWSYQTDPGNPELTIGAGVNTFKGGMTIRK